MTFSFQMWTDGVKGFRDSASVSFRISLVGELSACPTWFRGQMNVSSPGVLNTSVQEAHVLFPPPHPWYVEVPRLGVKLELQLPACTTATAMQDLRRICDLHHTSRQCQILNPLSRARKRIQVFMDTSQFHYRWATVGTPQKHKLWMNCNLST